MNNEPADAQTKTTHFRHQANPKPNYAQIASCPRPTGWLHAAACDVRPSTRAPKANPGAGVDQKVPPGNE
eukprot:9127594-Alexandrium_andersonii.AAC.1